MGIITNQAIRGNLTFGEGKAILSGKNSKGVATRLHITGDYKDGKLSPLDEKTFMQGLKGLIVKSSNMSKEYAKTEEEKADIDKNLKKRLSSLSGNGDIVLHLEEGSGTYDTGRGIFNIMASGMPRQTSKGNIFYNIKPVENSKGQQSFIPSTIKVFAMVMKREEFALLGEKERENIHYDKQSVDAKKWRWKELSVSDIERGNIDLLTVKYKATLNKIMSTKQDLKTIFSMENSYIQYMEKEHDRKFKNPNTLLSGESKENFVFPKTSIYIPDYLIIEKAGQDDLKGLLKTFFTNVNSKLGENEKFYIQFESENGSKKFKLDENSVDEIKDNTLVLKAYKDILEQLDFSQETLMKLSSKVEVDKGFMEYVKVCDSIHSAKNKSNYLKAMKNMLKLIVDRGLLEAPIEISYDLSTNSFEAKTNPLLAENLKEANLSVLKNIAKDITRPIESLVVKIGLSEKDTPFIKELQDNMSKFICVDKTNKSISYIKNENGFTLKDKMFLQVNGRVEKPMPFLNQQGETVTPKTFKAVSASKKEETKPYVGVTGVGGRSFEYPKTLSVLSSLGMSYIKQPYVPLNVNQTNSPQLKINPLTGEVGKINIVDKKTPKVETPKATTPKVETPKVETPKATTPKVEEKTAPTSLFEVTDNDMLEAEVEVEVPNIAEDDVKVAKQEDIENELDLLGGFSLEESELESFLGNDEEINIQVANEAENHGVSTIAP